MQSKSELSFGARANNAAKVRDNIQSFNNYNPPRNNETVENYSMLIQRAEESNTAVAVAVDKYNQATQARYNAFRLNEISVLKLLSPISRAVLAHYGKDSREAKTIMNIVTNMRAGKLLKKTNENGNEQSISQSEQSYGSILQSFKNLIATLGNFDGYNPSRTELKINTLTTFSNSLDALNQAVNISIASLREKRQIRNDYYIELNDSVKRIKAYVSAQYGINSIEYKSIKGLRV